MEQIDIVLYVVVCVDNSIQLFPPHVLKQQQACAHIRPEQVLDLPLFCRRVAVQRAVLFHAHDSHEQLCAHYFVGPVNFLISGRAL